MNIFKKISGLLLINVMLVALPNVCIAMGDAGTAAGLGGATGSAGACAEGSNFLDVVTSGNSQQVQLLLADGADPSQQNKTTGATPLMLACAAGDRRMVRLLLENEADIHQVRSPYGLETALSRACSHGDVVIITWLLEAGAGMRLDDLIMAAIRSDDKVVYCLLKAGADVNVHDWSSSTVLSNACGVDKNKSKKTVSLLLAAGADVEHEDYWGRNPLAIAGQAGNDEVVSELLKFGAVVETDVLNDPKIPAPIKAMMGSARVSAIIWNRRKTLCLTRVERTAYTIAKGYLSAP